MWLYPSGASQPEHSMNKESKQSLNSFDPSKFQSLVRKSGTVCSQDRSWTAGRPKTAQRKSCSSSGLIWSLFTTHSYPKSYQASVQKQRRPESTEHFQSRKGRRVLSLPSCGWPGEARDSRGSAENDSPKSTVVTNSAFFKPLGGINPFEFHRAKCLQFRANLGICFSFTAYMTHWY